MDLKTILSNHLCRILNIDDSVAENINILVTNLNILHNYFDEQPEQNYFQFCIKLKFYFLNSLKSHSKEWKLISVLKKSFNQ